MCYVCDGGDVSLKRRQNNVGKDWKTSGNLLGIVFETLPEQDPCNCSKNL